jgi:hypothetical protein
MAINAVLPPTVALTVIILFGGPSYAGHDQYFHGRGHPAAKHNVGPAKRHPAAQSRRANESFLAWCLR